MAGAAAVKVKAILFAAVFLPQAALAQDRSVCTELFQHLNNMPQIIGNTGEIRRYAKDLSRHNADIRQLRIEMRRQGCGSGSIVTLGSSDSDHCTGMRQNLAALEDERSALAASRNEARRLMQPSEQRVALLAALRENGCTPADPGEQDEAGEGEAAREIRREAEKAYMRVPGLALPKTENSSVNAIGTPAGHKDEAAKVQFPPERPYDPEKKVRMVGPQFLPQDDLDLARPRLIGPQPQQ